MYLSWKLSYGNLGSYLQVLGYLLHVVMEHGWIVSALDPQNTEVLVLVSTIWPKFIFWSNVCWYHNVSMSKTLYCLVYVIMYSCGTPDVTICQFSMMVLQVWLFLCINFHLLYMYSLYIIIMSHFQTQIYSV